MKYAKIYLIFIIIFQICCVINGDKIKVVSLNAWNLSNENGTIHINNLKSPIGVYTALKDEYGCILESKNDDNLRWIAYDNWTFSTVFGITIDKGQRVNLTLHGIDTVSTVHLNGYEIGKTENMFIRYSFDISTYLKSNNILEIKIKSPILTAKERAENLKENGINVPPDCPHVRTNGECHRNMLRKMQASFGGDWNLAAPSMGIWKPVDLEYYEVAIMRDVDVALRHNETHWTMDMRLFLSTDIRQKFFCDVKFIAVELLDKPIVFKREISYNSLKIEFKVDIPKTKIKLWWPNGYGEQKLYPLYFESNCYLNSTGPRLTSKTKSQKTIDVGFRTIELEEDLDDFGRTFYFKVNDQPIFIKGANFMPSHILPEYSYRESKLLHLIKSAKETHLNMLRVWGGGFYESDTFYNLTDFYGILVWQDLAFTASTYPFSDSFVESVRLETSQNARRLAFHPSLCMFVTNDEIELYLTKNKTELGADSARLEEEYKQMFMGTIRHELNVISRNDFNPRAGPMISTPSMGVEESKKEISIDPQNPNYGDVHFWENEKDGMDPDIYPRARFISEYGFQSLPALTAWNRTINKNDSLSDIVQHRQHDPKGFIPILKLILRHFALPAMDWEKNVEPLIYLSQLTQAMATKTATEVFRSHRTHKRTMGAIYWQLNDNWVAPSWSSIDYFGNYKMVWNWCKEFMAPTAIIALMDVKNSRINVTVTKEETVNDIEKPEIYNITMYTFLWSELYHRRSISWEVSLTSNGINTDYLDMSTVFSQPFTRQNCFLKFVLSRNNTTISSTFIIPSKITATNGLSDPQLKYGLSSTFCLNTNIDYIQYYTITITVKKPAVFVYLELYHPAVEKYKFSENGVIITAPIKVIHLEFQLKAAPCVTLTKENIRIITINDLILGDSPGYNNNGNDVTSTTVTTETSTTEEISLTEINEYRTVDVKSDVADFEIDLNHV
ncbi:beta-mannosidase-like [Lucilia cuprina]|uniref:beta-mannosidase-like n=1 Tax=Lucilia cuprina TaxID=7375 RepID=UPI001F061C7C|nr:beta-mannosidase-like [Lucilia cuprina]